VPSTTPPAPLPETSPTASYKNHHGELSTALPVEPGQRLGVKDRSASCFVLANRKGLPLQHELVAALWALTDDEQPHGGVGVRAVATFPFRHGDLLLSLGLILENS